MSITDELREWAHGFNGPWKRNEEMLLAIADRIDAEHEKECSRSWMRGHDVWASVGNEEVMAERGWVRFPVDADGVPIRVGDELTNAAHLPAKVRGMVLDESGWMVSTRELRGYGMPPATLRHFKPDSWESIIADALTIGWQNGNWNEVASADIHDRLVERCRRLAGEAE